jgi:hypothetical protein
MNCCFRQPHAEKAVTKLAGQVILGLVEAAVAKASTHFAPPYGPTEVVPLLQNSISVGFRNSL